MMIRIYKMGIFENSLVAIAVKRLLISKKLAFKTMRKSHINATFLFATILFIITITYPRSHISKANENKMMPEMEKSEETPSTLSTIHNQLVTNELGFAGTTYTHDQFVDDDDENTFIPPKNVLREERIAWFRRNLPRFDVLKEYSSNSRSFHSRVVEFLNPDHCGTNFYMTWLTSEKFFSERQLFTIDTLFKANPRACLVILSNSLDSIAGYRILKPFLDHGPQILAVAPDLPFLAKNTPVESWLREMRTGTRDPGSIPLSQNLSNLIRVLMLYKYGGVYLDTDVLVLRDFSRLRNCIGAQSIDPVSREWTRLNGAVMVFDIYHPVLHDFLEEFATSFDGNKWGNNGPYLISRVIERMLSLNNESSNLMGHYYRSYDFTVLPVWAFYPVNWLRINRLMKRPVNDSEATWDERILKELNGKKTYALHLWFNWSKDYKIEQGSVVARLISDHCLICYKISS